jgi:hypothetical protein
MRRYWLTFFAVLAVLLVLAPLLALQSQSLVLALLKWSVDSFTELRLDIKNPDIRLGDGVVSAEEIHLIPRGQAGPPLFSVINLDATTPLMDLLTGNLEHTLVSATQVLVYVSENDEARDPAPGSWMQLTTWLPSQFYVGQVHLITAAENTWIFPLRELQGRRLDTRTFRARALADYDGEPLELNLDIYGTHRDGLMHSLQVKAGFFAPESESRVSLEGLLEGREEQFHYDFSASANYRDIGEFVKGLDTDTELQGRMQLEARMVGDMRRFTLSDARMVLDNMPAYGFEAAGELQWERGGDSYLSLITAGEMSHLGYLVDWVDLDVEALGRAQASMNLSGSLENPVVDHFILVTDSEQGLSVNISGRLASLTLGPEAPVTAGETDNEVRVDIHAPSATVLEPWLGKIEYDPGPWRASWVMRGNRETLRLDNVVLETGTEQTLIARLEGTVGEVINSAEISPEMISGLDLTFNASTVDSMHLATLTGLDLPPYHALHAQLSLTGSGSRLDFTRGTLTVDSSDVQASVTDLSGHYRHDGEPTLLEAISGEIRVNISDTSILSQYTGLEVPVLGAADLKGSLQQTGTRFALEPLEIRINGDELELTATGRVDDLHNLSGVHLQNRVDRLELAQVLAFALDDFQYPGELAELQGDFRLAEREGQWQVSNLKMETVGSERTGPIHLAASGAINDLTGFITADVEAKLDLRDTALIAAITGLRAQPVTASGRIATTPERVDITALGVVGGSQLEAVIEMGYSGNDISRLTARIAAPHVNLADLGLQASEEDAYAPGADVQTSAKAGLEALLDKAPRYPTDIQVKFDGITGRNTNIDALDIHVTGEDDRYILRRFSMVYDAATAELRGVIDLNASPPFASLAGEALAIPVSTLAQDIGAPSDIRGTLTARGGVAASGTDLSSLVASLDGNLAIALEDTVIRGAAYDVLATDLLAWIYSGAALESSTYLNCTMGRFDIREGIARTDSLYIESERMIATGKGKFDLGRGQMDVTIKPRSRSRNFQIPSEVRLRGDMSDPRVTISPISAAADASAQALLLIPKLALRLFGEGGGRSDKGIRPCQASLE